MKYLTLLVILSLSSSCATNWNKVALMSQGVAQVYTRSEAANMRQQNYNYKIQQEALSRSQNRAPSCDNRCRQQRHNYQQQLLWLQLQNMNK